MSSSASFPDWSIFSGREEVNLGADAEPGAPAAEMAALLRTYQKARRDTESLLAQEQQRWQDALVQQAILVAQFEIVLGRYDAALAEQLQQLPGQAPTLQKAYRSFRILKDQMIEQLGTCEMKVEFPLGKMYSEVENVVVVEGWKHHQDYIQEIVVEVREPVVYFRGKLIHQGKVIMGGPLQDDDEFPADCEMQSA